MLADLICLLGSPDMWPYTGSSGDRRWWCVATDRVAHLDKGIFIYLKWTTRLFESIYLYNDIMIQEIGCVHSNRLFHTSLFWQHFRVPILPICHFLTRCSYDSDTECLSWDSPRLVTLSGGNHRDQAASVSRGGEYCRLVGFRIFFFWFLKSASNI